MIARPIGIRFFLTFLIVIHCETAISDETDVNVAVDALLKSVNYFDQLDSFKLQLELHCVKRKADLSVLNPGVTNNGFYERRASLLVAVDASEDYFCAIENLGQRQFESSGRNDLDTFPDIEDLSKDRTQFNVSKSSSSRGNIALKNKEGLHCFDVDGREDGLSKINRNANVFQLAGQSSRIHLPRYHLSFPKEFEHEDRSSFDFLSKFLVEETVDKLVETKRSQQEDGKSILVTDIKIPYDQFTLFFRLVISDAGFDKGMILEFSEENLDFNEAEAPQVNGNSDSLRKYSNRISWQEYDSAGGKKVVLPGDVRKTEDVRTSRRWSKGEELAQYQWLQFTTPGSDNFDYDKVLEIGKQKGLSLGTKVTWP